MSTYCLLSFWEWIRDFCDLLADKLFLRFMMGFDFICSASPEFSGQDVGGVG
jgi:hypothetical protein